jgi:hypothetical protein
VVRFEFEQSGRHIRSWMLLEEGAGEICNFDPASATTSSWPSQTR